MLILGTRSKQIPRTPVSHPGLRTPVHQRLGTELPKYLNGGAQPFNPAIDEGFLSPTYGEDCLWVNIYISPGATLDGSLPVLVNIHGGG